VVLLVAGVLLAGFGLILMGAAAPLAAALFQQNRQGYVTSPTERYAVPTYAITSERLEVVLDQGVPAAGRAGPVASFVLRATAATPEKEIFLGVGPETDVARYLSSVEHSELTRIRFNPFRPTFRTVAGSKAPTPPADQDFWAVSAQGPGTQQIEADLRTGNWAVVIMNADASQSVAVDLQAGIRSRFLAPVTLGTFLFGLALLAVGIPLLVAGASGLGRSGTTPVQTRSPSAVRLPTALSPTGSASPVRSAATPYPARLTGRLDPEMSRWLWLVKWALAIPHYLVLMVLWFAFVVTTVVAGIAILFTGRYPRSIFAFNVGVLRWSWRVGFYTYAALGTDRYPPFTLARTDYPADFDVDYPERLSRGLVLIKSWLLAIPHLLIVGLFTTDVGYWWSTRGDWESGYQNTAGISLLGLLVVVAGFFLLIARQYPPALFDLILGLNRWVYRVITYVALMRDEYPPFHLDQGGADPADVAPSEHIPGPDPDHDVR
jgi:hypothetical protein